jgi:hypothetical protein
MDGMAQETVTTPAAQPCAVPLSPVVVSRAERTERKALRRAVRDLRAPRSNEALAAQIRNLKRRHRRMPNREIERELGQIDRMRSAPVLLQVGIVAPTPAATEAADQARTAEYIHNPPEPGYASGAGTAEAPFAHVDERAQEYEQNKETIHRAAYAARRKLRPEVADVLRLVLQGKTQREIADELLVSQSQVSRRSSEGLQALALLINPDLLAEVAAYQTAQSAKAIEHTYAGNFSADRDRWQQDRDQTPQGAELKTDGPEYEEWLLSKSQARTTPK